ncbi:unnamed protein product [Arctia plantaginis]|uniref:Uncharacterized protein n=1 Tax=Arctia plantaginis TaxID=874455 RepID=A0A8S1BNY2_ARCPL|nr:unnamed protein product [Arctia plantaginis]
MIREFVLFFILVSCVYGEGCVRYTFEEGFYELFDDDSELCENSVPWLLELYKHTHLTSPHVLSTKYINPQEVTSCVSSFTFPMNFGGIIEVNAFVQMTDNADALYVAASKVVTNDSVQSAGSIAITPHQPDFKPGWHALRFTLSGIDEETFNGYVSD